MTEQKTFNIDLKALASCAPAMSTEETRHYLKGVHIFERNGEMIYEATNGHYLIQVSSTVEQDAHDIQGINIILPAFIVKELSKKSFRSGFGVGGEALVECAIDGNRINVEMINGLVNFKLLEGGFPDTERVIPKEASCKALSFDEIGFNPQYLSDIGKSLKNYTGFSILNLAFSGNSGNEPVMVRCQSPAWFAVLMPARI